MSGGLGFDYAQSSIPGKDDGSELSAPLINDFEVNEASRFGFFAISH